MVLGRKIPLRLWVGLWLAVILDTAVQLCWKSATLHIPQSASLLETAVLTLHQPLFIAAMLMFLAQFVNWMQVLSKADLSFAHPFTALSYISVCGLSALLLHETQSPARLFGVALILMGVWFISQTKHHTPNEELLDGGKISNESKTAVER